MSTALILVEPNSIPSAGLLARIAAFASAAPIFMYLPVSLLFMITDHSTIYNHILFVHQYYCISFIVLPWKFYGFNILFITLNFSYDLTAEQMGDWAAAMGIEAVYIDKDTNIRDFKNELRWNELAFRK